MYKTISIKGKRYRVDTRKAKETAATVAVIIGLALEAVWFIGWCNYWF